MQETSPEIHSTFIYSASLERQDISRTALKPRAQGGVCGMRRVQSTDRTQKVFRGGEFQKFFVFRNRVLSCI